MKSTIDRLRIALALQREREFAKIPFVRLPSKRQAKAGHTSCLKARRAAHKGSMLNMPRPAGHKTLPQFPSEREKTLFAAHASRKEAGWIRG